MAEVRLPAEVRTEFGKGGARRTRRAGKIPAVIYGHGADPQHVSLPAREFANAIRHGGKNVLLTLELDGNDQLAIPKAIQRHPIKDQYEHVDLLAVRRGEKVTIDVPLQLVGDIAPGGLLAQEHTTVSVEAEATHLPTGIEVNIDGAEVGTQIHARDLTLPRGTSLITDPDQVLVLVQEAPTAEQLEATETAEGDAGTAAAADTDAVAPAEAAQDTSEASAESGE
jgi:large subunit ribosomal protein L25